jgi:hypothetical protein
MRSQIPPDHLRQPKLCGCKPRLQNVNPGGYDTVHHELAQTVGKPIHVDKKGCRLYDTSIDLKPFTPAGELKTPPAGDMRQRMPPCLFTIATPWIN